MESRKYHLLFLNLLFFVTLISCKQEKINPPLATFNGGEVLQDEYIDLYLKSTIYKPDDSPTEENLKSLINRLAMEKIASLQAKKEIIDTTGAFRDTYTKDERKILYQNYVQDEMIARVITDSLVRKFYQSLNPQYRMAYIMRPFDETLSEEFVASQKDSIEYVYQLLQAGGDFSQLAKKYSQETTTKDKGGDLGYVIEESLGDAKLREVMASLNENSYSKPFRGYSGYYILYKGEKREVSVPSFEETKGQIWETLFRTRRHNIKDLVKKRLEELKPLYQYKINEKNIAIIAAKAGGNKDTSIYKTLRFDLLDKQDMNLDAAAYSGGSIKVYEIFRNPKTNPINLYEFRKDLQSISEQHLFAQEAKKMDLDKVPGIKKELDQIREAILRGIYYQREVRDKATAKTDSVKALAAMNKQTISRDDLQTRYFAFEKTIRENYETRLKEDYQFTYLTDNFSQALTIAKRKKEIQNKEREEKSKK